VEVRVTGLVRGAGPLSTSPDPDDVAVRETTSGRARSTPLSTPPTQRSIQACAMAW
jgi:hypothetical protein